MSSKSNYLDFTNDNPTVYFMLIDSSGSMDSVENKVIEALRLYKKSFDNFPEKGSIAVSVSHFDSDVHLDCFQAIDDLSFQYSTLGATALCYSIIEGAKFMNKYLEEITEKKNMKAKAVFIVFSDGEPCEDMASFDDAAQTVEGLNFQGITTVFVAFRDAVEKGIGEMLKFQATQDVTNPEDLKVFFGETLSESCKEASRSMKPLGSNFFSATTKSKSSTEFSAATQTSVADDEWIADI